MITVLTVFGVMSKYFVHRDLDPAVVTLRQGWIAFDSDEGLAVHHDSPSTVILLATTLNFWKPVAPAGEAAGYLTE